MQHAQQDMQKWISDLDLTDRQKLALTCRILFDHGHDAGLAGKLPAVVKIKNPYSTFRFRF
jgi:L-fuculose-phosphate aldolase